MRHEQYSETLGEHQYPVIALSEWQEWNDLRWADWSTQREEETEERIRKKEQRINEHHTTQTLLDYSSQ